MGLLLIHTAGTSPLVAFHHPNQEPLFFSEGQDHAQHLPLILNEILSQINTQSITSFAVCVGTGSYTALRIGITAAKMLALSWNIPLIPLHTSMIYAYNLRHASPKLPIAVVLDTKREKLRLETFSPQAPLSPHPPLMLTPQELHAFFSQNPHHITGDASSHFPSHPLFITPPKNLHLSALHAALALQDTTHAISEPHLIDAIKPIYFGDKNP